ncbi:MAG: peptidase M14, partial [Gammaproteobacteria bacterium]
MSTQLLTQLDHLPDGFLTTHAQQLHSLLPHPTLIHLPGRLKNPLFVSILLHGNEMTGLAAIQALLKKYLDRELPRALSIFVGNISAARHNLRRLEGQPDYNRIWPGSEAPSSPETAMAQQVFDEMSKRSPFASIDVHNNTGLNPHYACINKLGQPFFHLAALFSRTAVFFTYPKGVQSAAFAELCPAVTLECGKPDQKQGAEHALEFIESCLHLSEHPQHPIAHNDIELFHTVAQVK